MYICSPGGPTCTFAAPEGPHVHLQPLGAHMYICSPRGPTCTVAAPEGPRVHLQGLHRGHETKLPMHSLCPTREWEREWYGVTTPNIISGQGVIVFPFGATPPLIGEAEEVVAAEPLGAFNRDPNDLVLTVGGRLVVNHLLEHDFLSGV